MDDKRIVLSYFIEGKAIQYIGANKNDGISKCDIMKTMVTAAYKCSKTKTF